MNLDGARNAKAEVFEEVFHYQAAPTAAVEGRSSPLFLPMQKTSAHKNIVDGRKRKRRDARDLISLGILAPENHNRNPNDLQLGIFIQRDDLRQHPIVEAAQRHARGEAQVIYTGRIRRRAVNPGRCRPLRIGASVGHYRVSAGTIGCFCKHEGGGIGILSNNHILADTNQASRGDIILQQARKDGGNRKDAESRAATLFDFVPIDFAADTRNLVDCAFASLIGGVTCDAAIAQDPRDPGNRWSIAKAPVDLLANDPVKKIGRTTGFTRGQVVAIDVDNVVVAMTLGHGERLARFDNQIVIEGSDGPFSAGGDSGSLICADDGSPAALLFAGTETGGKNGYGVTFANPIRAVPEALDLEIYTDS